MPNITTYFGVLLLVMTLVMMGVAIRTCVLVFRLRNKRMSWRAGTFKGFPLFSTIFLGVSITLTALMWTAGGTSELAGAMLYMMMSSAWFVSSYFASKRYITDHGIVKNVNDPAQTVAWHQIHDFFEQKTENGHEYTFIYRKNNSRKLEKVIRLQLQVPEQDDTNFKKLISHKLGRRISCYEGSIDVAQFQ